MAQVRTDGGLQLLNKLETSRASSDHYMFDLDGNYGIQGNSGNRINH